MLKLGTFALCLADEDGLYPGGRSDARRSLVFGCVPGSDKRDHEISIFRVEAVSSGAFDGSIYLGRRQDGSEKYGRVHRGIHADEVLTSTPTLVEAVAKREAILLIGIEADEEVSRGPQQAMSTPGEGVRARAMKRLLAIVPEVFEKPPT